MSEGKRQATFMMAGGQTIKGMNIEQFERYLKHIEEEVSELRRDYEAGDMVKVVDALMDIKVVCNGASLSLGIDPDEGMKIVDTANMSKIGPDGKVSRRPDGQIAKGAVISLMPVFPSHAERPPYPSTHAISAQVVERTHPWQSARQVYG